MRHALSRGLAAHRDIKPDNLLVTSTGDLKITDFGLARPVQSAAQAGGQVAGVHRTGVGAIVGTLPYMAPEQFLQPATVDHRCDIYAFGLVLYQVASGGRYPFRVHIEGRDLVEEFARHHLRSEVPALGSPLDAIIFRCLQKAPTTRYQTFDELDEALSAEGERAGIPLPPPYSGVGDEMEELFQKAQSLAVLGMPREALASIDAYLAKAPRAYWAWTERGRLMLEAADDPAASVEASRTSLAIYPANSHAWNNLGIALARLGRVDEALEAYAAALHADPLNTGAMTNAAASFFESGNVAEAGNYLLRALELAPQKQRLLFNAGNLAAAMAKRGALGPARRVLSQLTRVDPSNVQAWHNLALVSQAAGQQTEAIRCFERVVALDSTDAFALRSLAKLYAATGQVAEALGCCDRLLAIDAEFVAAVSMKAQLLAYAGRTTEAFRTLEEATRRHPEADTLWFVLSVVAEQAGDLGRTRTAARECHRLLKRQGTRANPNNVADIEDRLQRLSDRL